MFGKLKTYEGKICIICQKPAQYYSYGGYIEIKDISGICEPCVDEIRDEIKKE